MIRGRISNISKHIWKHPDTARWEGEGQERGEKIRKKFSKIRIIQSVSPALCSHSLFFSNSSSVFMSPGASHTNLCRVFIVLCPAPHSHHGLRSHMPRVFYTVPSGSGNFGHYHPQLLCENSPARHSSAKQSALLHWALSYLEMIR